MILKAVVVTLVLWRSERRWKFWVGTAAAVVAGGGAVRLLRDPSMQSRCPAAAPFGVLIDPIVGVRQGSTLRVYYDVCGLARGTPYQLSIVIATPDLAPGRRAPAAAGRRGRAAVSSAVGEAGTTGPGISGLVHREFTESAKGPATRVRRDLGDVRFPPGRYRLTVTATDARQERRSRTASFRVLPASAGG